MLRHYIKIAFRNLWKYKTQNLIGIFCLAIGLVCFSLCNYYSQFYLNFNKSIPNAEKMYNMSTRLPEEVLSHQFPEIEKVFPFSPMSLNTEVRFDTQGKNTQSRTSVSIQDTTLIDFLSIEVVAGNIYDIKHSQNSIILFESKAKELGYENYNELIGIQIEIGSYGVEGQVKGILKDSPTDSQFAYMNKAFLLFNYSDQTRERYIYSYFLLLKDQNSVKQLEEKLDRYLQNHPDYKYTEEEAYTLESITDYYNWTDSSMKTSIFLLIFGLLLVLLALFNFISFQTTLIINKQKDYAIQKVNGISKLQLFGSVFVQFLIYFFLACGLAFLVIEYLSFFQAQGYYQLSYTELVPYLLKMQFLTYVGWGILFLFFISLVVTYVIYKVDIHLLFRGKKRGGNAIRNILLIIQLAILLVFLCTALVVNRQTEYTKQKLFSNITIEEQERIIGVSCSFSQLRGNRDILMKNIQVSSAVSEVTCSQEPVFRTFFRSSSEYITGMPEDQQVRGIVISPSFFHFFHANLLQGSYMNESSDSETVVVNRAFTDLFPEESIIGKSFIYNYYNYHVVGVVDGLQIIQYDIKDKENIMQTMPIFFRFFSQYGDGNYFTLYVKAVPGKVKEAEEDIRRCLNEFIPEGYDIEMNIFKDDFDSIFSEEQLFFSVSSLFFMFSLLIALVSIYSSILTNVEKRRKEVAIRKINGAEIRNILVLFGKTYVFIWTAVCIVIFPLVYYVANGWLETFADRVSFPGGIFLEVYFGILALMFICILFEILSVARENPVKTLKN